MIEEAIAREPGRPEAYFNLALLIDTNLQAEPERTASNVARADALYDRFLQLVGDDPEYAEEIQHARYGRRGLGMHVMTETSQGLECHLAPRRGSDEEKPER
jgi:hypothetical protein